MHDECRSIIFFRHSLLNRGGDKMILAHASRLAELGHQVELWVSEVDTLFPVSNAIRIRKIKSNNKVQTLFAAAIFRSKTDVVVADIIPLACLLGLRNRKKVIYFAQDYDESYYMQFWKKLFIRLLYFFGLTLLNIKSIAVAEHLTSLLSRRFNARVVTVNNGVDIQMFYPDPDTSLLQQKAGRFAVIMFSRQDPRKGFDLGRKIIANVQSKVLADNLEVWTVGTPVTEGFSDVLHRDFGYVDADQLRQIFSSADAFLYHTRHEGFPLMALEALACRCPMAASSAVPVVRHNDEALISPVGDIDMAVSQLIRILQCDALSERLRLNGLEFAKNHTLDLSTQRFSELLLQTCCSER